jgi:hypothetical protein
VGTTQLLMKKVLLGLMLLLLVSACSQKVNSNAVRWWYFPQTRQLADGTKVRMEAAWICDGHPPLLRVKFAHVGRDPLQRYVLRAALRGKPDAEDLNGQLVWYVGLPRQTNTPASETPMCWEFQGFPTNSAKIYLRVTFQDMADNASKEITEFVIPSAKDLELRDTSIP